MRTDLKQLAPGGATSGQPIVWNSTTGVYNPSSVVTGSVFQNTNGSSAADVCVKVGTTLADGSVHASAKLFEVRDGIGGTEVSKFSVDKAGDVRNATGIFRGASTTQGFLGSDDGFGTRVAYGANNVTVASTGITAVCGDYKLIVNATRAAFIGVSGDNNTHWFEKSGEFRQKGTDSSASPGAATANTGNGIATIASGATTCVITNSIAVATSRVMITWYGDSGAGRSWVVRAAGSFAVTLSSAATANTSFGWEVSNIL